MDKIYESNIEGFLNWKDETATPPEVIPITSVSVIVPSTANNNSPFTSTYYVSDKFVPSMLAVKNYILSQPPASIPIASTTQLGGIKVGTGLTADGNGVLSVTGASEYSPKYLGHAGSLESGMTLYAAANRGDFFNITDTNIFYVLGTTGASTANNWLKFAGVTTVNGQSGDVTITPYTLPTASENTLGGIKVGSGLAVTQDGTLSAAITEIPIATSSTVGGIKVGSRLTIVDGVLSADEQTFTLPTASASTLGGVKVGSGLGINSGVLSAKIGGYLGSASNFVDGVTLYGQTANKGDFFGITGTSVYYVLGTDVGGIYANWHKFAGQVTSVNGQQGDVTIAQYTLPTASSSVLGGVKIGTGLNIDSGTGKLSASSFSLGVKTSDVDNGAIILEPNTNRYKSTVTDLTNFFIYDDGIAGLGLDYMFFLLAITTGTTYGPVTYPENAYWETAKPVIVANSFYRIEFETFNGGTNWAVRHLNPDTTTRPYLTYSGNYIMTTAGINVALAKGYGVYYVDLSAYTGGTAAFTVDSSGFGFTSEETGGECRIIIKLPSTAANIPTITFGSNIVFADFEEVDRWEAGKTYVLNLITNNSGTRWIVTDVEVY